MHVVSIVFFSIVCVWLADCARMIPRRSVHRVIPRAGHAGAAEVTLVLTDHHFRLDRPIEGGPTRWHVRNEGTDIIRA
jgi:hypothetical protein